MTPAGFTPSRAGRTRVWLREDLADRLRGAGLASPATWWAALDAAARGGAGRAATARLDLPGGGPRLVLKRLARGGLLASAWRGRFLGDRRLLENLSIPDEALRRGVATARGAALVAIPGPPGFFRGLLAVEEIEGAADLRDLLGRGPLDAASWEAVAAALRAMHAAGLDHPDLNLGNLLLRPGRAGPEAFVVDLDGARLRAGPLPFSARQSALRRLERSCHRVLGPEAGAAAADAAYAAYAGGDADVARRFAAGRGRGRLLLALRSLGRG